MMWLLTIFIIHFIYFIALILQDNEMSSMDMNDINLESDTFIISCDNNTISCDVLFIFENVNKLIDLDLIITALDVYSFEDYGKLSNTNTNRIYNQSLF